MRHFTGFPRPITELGWTSLIVAITFFSGTILFSLGFIGQYIFKIIEEVNKTPNYQIRNVIEYKKKAKGKRVKKRYKGTKKRDKG